MSGYGSVNELDEWSEMNEIAQNPMRFPPLVIWNGYLDIECKAFDVTMSNQAIVRSLTIHLSVYTWIAAMNDGT